MAAGQERGYDAFISYSHRLDAAITARLQSELEHFAKPWYRVRALHVFRDQTSLAASPHLWTTIEEALSGSGWLILMASPESAQSAWVAREISWWRAHRPMNHLLIAVTGGELAWDETGGDLDWAATTALPEEVLGHAFTQEPHWVDLRWARGSEDSLRPADPRLQDAVADLAAAIRHVPKDTLIGEHIQHRRRTVQAALAVGAALVVLLAFSLTAAFIAKAQRDRADRENTTATAGLLASTAVSLTSSHPDLAQLFAVQAYRLDPGNPQARAALFATVQADPQVQRFLQAPGPVSALAVSANGHIAVAGARNGWVRGWSLSTFRPVSLRPDDRACQRGGGQRGRGHGGRRDQPGRHDVGARPAGRVPHRPAGNPVHRGRDIAVRDVRGVRRLSRPGGAGYGRPVLAAGPAARVRHLAPGPPPARHEPRRAQRQRAGRARWPVRILAAARAARPHRRRLRPQHVRAVQVPRLHLRAVTGRHAVHAQLRGRRVEPARAEHPAARPGGPCPSRRPAGPGPGHQPGRPVDRVRGRQRHPRVPDRPGRPACRAPRTYPGAEPLFSTSLAFAGPSDTRLVSASGNLVTLWNLAQYSRIGRAARIPMPWRCGRVCPGPRLAIQPGGREAALTDSNGDRLLRAGLGASFGTVTTIATGRAGEFGLPLWGRTGNRLYLAGRTLSVVIPGGKGRAVVVRANPDPTQDLALSADGRLLFTVGASGTVRIGPVPAGLAGRLARAGP